MDIRGVVPALLMLTEDTNSGHLCLPPFIQYYSALPALLTFPLASLDSSFLSSISVRSEWGPISKTSLPVEHYEVSTCAPLSKDPIPKRRQLGFPHKDQECIHGADRKEVWTKEVQEINRKLHMVASQYMFAEIKLVPKAWEDICLKMCPSTPKCLASIFPFMLMEAYLSTWNLEILKNSF